MITSEGDILASEPSYFVQRRMLEVTGHGGGICTWGAVFQLQQNVNSELQITLIPSWWSVLGHLVPLRAADLRLGTGGSRGDTRP